MNDQPPPGSEKKPRRRSAPRKRAPAKRAAKAVETSGRQDGDGALEAEVAIDAAPAVVGGAPKPAAAVSGAPLPGDAKIDPPSASSADEPQAQHADPSIAADGLPRASDTAHADAAPVPAPATAAGATTPAATDTESAGTPATPSFEAPVAERLDPAPLKNVGGTPLAATSGQGVATTTPDAPHARDTSSPAPEAQAAARESRASTDASAMRQASLRPGELIRVPLSVRWRDLDAFNHVNNSKYLSYLEEARLRWMLSVPGMGLDEHVAPVVAASNLNYRRPIGWPGDVVIELFVERMGGSSVTIGHRIVDSKEGGVVYCDGNVVMVWIDRESGRSAPLPESVRAACR